MGVGGLKVMCVNFASAESNQVTLDLCWCDSENIFEIVIFVSVRPLQVDLLFPPCKHKPAMHYEPLLGLCTCTVTLQTFELEIS